MWLNSKIFGHTDVTTNDIMIVAGAEESRKIKKSAHFVRLKQSKSLLWLS